jgi:MFS family permease
LTGAVLWSLVSNPWVGSTFLVALLAIALLAGDSPTRAALYTELNLPEHRGTVTGFMTIATGLGLALGNWLAGLTISSLAHFYAPPLNYALGLALFQLWLIPAGWCYYQISKSVAEDLAGLKRTLSLRAESEPDPFT